MKQKLLSFLLAFCMILGMAPMTLAVSAASTTTDYYIKAGGTGDGRSVSAPAGSAASVIASINADHPNSGNVTVYVIPSDANTTELKAGDSFGKTLPSGRFVPIRGENQTLPAHKATITYTTYNYAETGVRAPLAFGPILASDPYNGYAHKAQGDEIFKNILLIDVRHGYYTDIYAQGHSLVFDNCKTLAFHNDNGTYKLRTFGGAFYALGRTADTVAGSTNTFDNAAAVAGKLSFSGWHADDQKYEGNVSGNITYALSNATYPQVEFGSSPKGTTITYGGDVNLVLTNAAVSTLKSYFYDSATNGESTVGSVKIGGALQLIKNNSTIANIDLSAVSAVNGGELPIYTVNVPTASGVTLGATDTTGKYTVSSTSGKIAYCVASDGRSIYYGDTTLTLPSAGTYEVYGASSVDAIKSAVQVPADFVNHTFKQWKDDGNGTITAEWDVTVPTYYVSASGSDDNDGLTPQTPFKSYAKATSLVGSGDIFVYVMGDITIDPSKVTEFSGKITLSGYDSSASITAKESSGLAFGGTTTLMNITYHRGTNAYIATKGQDITFEEGFKTTSTSDWFVFGASYTDSVGGSTITVKDGNFTGHFAIGGIMPPKGSTLHVSDDVALLTSGGTIDSVELGSSQYSECGSTTFDKNLLIYQNGGTIKKISAVMSGNGAPTKVTGALEILLNDASTAVLDDSIADMTVGKRYIVRASKGGHVAPVYNSTSGELVAGKVKITIDKQGDWATVVNGSKRDYYNADSEITLSEGTTEITFASEKQYAKGTTIPMTWKTMDKGYITLIFDDNNDSLPKFYNIITGEYNMPMCAAVPSNSLNRNNAILHEIQNHGGEILSHTRDHIVLNRSIPWETVDYQLGQSYRELTADGFNVHGIILAGGEGQDQSEDYRKDIEGFTNKYYHYSDKYGASTQYWKQRNWFSGRTVEELKSIIDTHIANKSWEVIYAHNFNECSETTLRAVLDYLKQKKEEGKVDVVTYRYVHENLANWASPVDFGDTTYTVEFYGSDKTTYLGRSVTVRGETAALTGSLKLADGYTFDSWSQSVANVQDNLKVYAICKDASGNTVSPSIPSVIGTQLSYYIDATNGSNSNDGLTKDTAFADFKTAIHAANGSDFDAIVVGEIQVSDQSFSEHVGVMTVRGYDENAKLSTVASSGTYFGGPCVIRDITFVNGKDAWCSLGGDDFVFGNNVTTVSGNQIAIGGYYAKVPQKANATIQSGTFRQVIMGSMAALNSDHTVAGDARLTLTGGKINELLVSNQGWDSNAQKKVIFNRNVLVRVDGGTLGGVKVATAYAPTFNGAVEFIFNNDTTTTFDQSFTDIPAAGGNYYVYSKGTEGKVDFSYNDKGESITGEFYVTVPNGKIAIIKNGESTKLLTASGKVTLAVGTTTVTYGDITDYADRLITVKTATGTDYYLLDDSIAIAKGGTITFPTTVAKSGKLFAGWYADAAFTSPIAQGGTVAAGTIYARYLTPNDMDLYFHGVQIRIGGSLGLRYVSSITSSLRTALIGLHADNAALDPTNKTLFNMTEDIGYGSVVLPTEALGENALEKGKTYTYGGKDYASATVPARKTFDKNDSYDRYTVALTGIPENASGTEYTVRAYITYLDASGIKHTYYGEPYATSLYATAKYIYENGASSEPEDKKQETLDYMYNNILTKFDGVTSPLANTYRALRFDKKLTVGYIGGSITYGNSAAKKVNDNGTVSQTGGDIALSYVNRTTDYLRAQYPQATIESINAGVSDTATNFGIYRLNDHLMNTNGHDMPDLVFVEFTTNDWCYDGGIVQNDKDLARQAESLIRNIYAKNPYADIVLLSTVRDANGASRKVYEKLGKDYGLLFIDLGVPLQQKMTARGAANEADGTYYYTVDNLHPSAKGYEVYFEEIKNGMTAALETTIYATAKTDRTAALGKASARSLWENPTILPVSDFTVESGSVANGSNLTMSMYGTNETQAQNVAVTNGSLKITEETTLSFKFTGTTVALLFGMNESGVLMDYTVDGRGSANTKTLNIDTELLTFQKYGHTQLFVLEQELAYGEHTIKMTFKPTSDGKVNVLLGGAAVAGVDNGLQKLIALSIDDGPRSDTSNAILNVLEKYGAHATFFAVGGSINESLYPVMKRMIAADCEIGNHGFGWNTMVEMTAAELTDDFNKVQSRVYAATGVYPKVFRAPGNQVSETMYQTIPLPIFNGYLGVSDWEDESTVGVQARINALRNNIVDGRIILIHDVMPNAEALDTVLPEMIAQGYKIVTISELYTLRGYKPSAGHMYGNFDK